MQISALTDIVEGELLNSPSISFITQIHTNLNKVNEGDAFFATNTEDIKQAIKQGVFAIIVDFDLTIVDNEIAWIKVDNLRKAITNILRYKLVDKDFNYININIVFFNLLTIFKTKELNKITILLSNDLYKDFETLHTIDSKKNIFCTNLSFLNSISPNVIELKQKIFDIKNLTMHSLFEVSFSHKNKFFEKLKLPELYINDFLQLFELFDIELDIRKLNNINLFKPIFINKSNQIVQHGQTNRFILSNKEQDIYNIEISFLENKYSYATMIVIDATNYTDMEIFNCIENLNFNALYIKGQDIKHIHKILEFNNNLEKLF